jgi:hypothetical protein
MGIFRTSTDRSPRGTHAEACPVHRRRRHPGADDGIGRGPAALAASERLPIRSGPNGVSRASGGVTTRIMGGTAVPNGKYTFQAALLAQSFGANDFERQYCGGSLITPFEVLTAAPLRRVLRRRAGPAAHQRPAGGGRPDRADQHPGPEAAGRGHQHPAAGRSRRRGQLPDRTREAQIPIASRAGCRTAYASAGATIDATMLCAGRTNLDTCQGDSGGPLFFRAAGGGFLQAGITSWGIGCGAPASPGSTPASATRGWGTSSSRSPEGPGELDTSRITSPPARPRRC